MRFGTPRNRFSWHNNFDKPYGTLARASNSSLEKATIQMIPTSEKYRHILVANDFSEYSEAALKQAIWLARKHGAQLTIVHVHPSIRNLMLSASMQARLDFLYGDGEKFQKEVREKSHARMQEQVSALQADDLKVSFRTLIGEPFQELTHAVLEQECDLVVSGSRGLKAWENFLLGSTAKHLIRSCPASVWIVKHEMPCPPRRILAPTDFSEVSLKAVRQGFQLAKEAQAEFHLLHVIDSMDIPEEFISQYPEGASFQQEMNKESNHQLQALRDSISPDDQSIQIHSTWGTPWKEIKRIEQEIAADTISLGTVGRSGIKGVLLGNTAEKVLSVCHCSIITTKPDDYISPIQSAFWELSPKS
ncbi:MAG: universal stress protein [Candidatus Spechtbacterales bacterium]